MYAHSVGGTNRTCSVTANNAAAADDDDDDGNENHYVRSPVAGARRHVATTMTRSTRVRRPDMAPTDDISGLVPTVNWPTGCRYLVYTVAHAVSLFLSHICRMHSVLQTLRKRM